MRIAALLATALILAFTTPLAAQDNSAGGTIALVGVGEVAGAPDMAIISSGVLTYGKTAREALNANTAAVNEIFSLLQATNITQQDMQTSGFSVRPQFNHSDQRDANGYPLPPRISGYQVSNTLTVKVRNLSDLGQLLDRSVSVGSNQINSISFAVTDPAPLLNQARKAAMGDAIAKAQLYAEAAGVRLGKIISITEGSPISAPQPEMMMMARMADSGPVPVAAGELSFSKQISVVWQLAQD